MQEQAVLRYVNEELNQLHSYKKLLRTTLDTIGEDEASLEFTITTSRGQVLRSSPVRLVEIEEILVAELLRSMLESNQHEDESLRNGLYNFLR